MTTLTTAQIVYIRAKSGDNKTHKVVTDDIMQTYFDDADDDLPATIVSVLEDRWAYANAQIAQITDFNTAVDTENIQHIERLLEYWRRKAGIYDAPRAATGTLSLGIDQTEDDE